MEIVITSAAVNKKAAGTINGQAFEAYWHWNGRASQSGTWRNSLRFKLSPAENQAIGRAIKKYLAPKGANKGV